MSFTVIPPGPVTEHAKLDLRCAVGPEVRAVTFSCDGTAFATVLPRGGLARAPWPATGKAGTHTFTATAGDEVLGTWTLEVVASTTRALPRLTGAWIDGGSFGPNGYVRDRAVEPDDVTAMVEATAALGMTTLVLTYVEYTGVFYYPSAIEFHDRDNEVTARAGTFGFDLVGTVLEAADRTGQHVILGLGRGGDLWLCWHFDAPDWSERNAFGIDLSSRIAAELWQRYGHHRSFYGWYLTHEMNDLARASAYYDPVARACKALAPDKPVMCAPSGTPIVDRATLAASAVDIFAYQDAVGAGYVPYEYTWDPARRLAQLEEVYASYADAHRGTDKHLWADLETWEMNGSQGYRGSYPPSFSRVRQQIEIEAKHVDVLTGYEYSGFFEHPGSAVRLADDRARRLYDDYHAYVKGLS